MALCAGLVSGNFFAMEAPQVPDTKQEQLEVSDLNTPDESAYLASRSCGLSHAISSKVVANEPARTMLEEQWGFKGDISNENNKVLYKRMRAYRKTCEEAARCAADKKDEIEKEEAALLENPLRVKGSYLGAGFAQAIVGMGCLALLAYDIKNMINGGLIEKESLFTAQTAHLGTMKASAYVMLCSGSLWGLKNGFYNVKKGANLAKELELEKLIARDNEIFFSEIGKFMSGMRKANPNLKTPKGQRNKKTATINEAKNTVNHI